MILTTAVYVGIALARLPIRNDRCGDLAINLGLVEELEFARTPMLKACVLTGCDLEFDRAELIGSDEGGELEHDLILSWLSKGY